MRIYLPIILALSFGLTPLAANAQAEEYFKPGMPGVVTSVEAFAGSSQASADSIALAAQYAASQHNYDQAIRLCQRALKKDDDDLDIHLIFAQALTEKLQDQKKKDPRIYNQAVKEWLMVYRSERGEERGMTWHGLALPAMRKRMEDDERQIPAGSALVALTGRVPRNNETDAKYLRSVTVDTTKTVEGTIISKSKTKPKDGAQSAGKPAGSRSPLEM